MKQLKKLFLVPAIGLALLAGQAQATTDEAVAERLKPVGNLCIQGQDCTQPEKKQSAATVSVEQAKEEPVAEQTEAAAEVAPEAAPAASAARSGEDVYKTACVACHASGVAGAPLTGDTAAWQARYDAEGGLAGLLAISKAGKGAMPPMGTCANCSDEELNAAIEFMSGL